MTTMLKVEEALLQLAQAQIKTDEQLKSFQKETKESTARLDKNAEESKKQWEESNKKWEKSNKKWENFMGNSAQVTEEYFYRSLDKDKTLGELKFNEIDRNIKKTDNHVEFDIILINGDSIGIIEVKNKAHPKDIKPLIEKKIKHFKIDYPQYEEYKYYFGIATMITNKQMIKEAKNEGIFLLTQNADHLEIVNVGVNTF